MDSDNAVEVPRARRTRTRRANPAPTTRTALNRDYIAAVALNLIDRTGVDGFSMRKLGTALGADPMAAYRHFTDQQELFDAIADTMFAELDMESLPWQEPWRDLMRAYAHRLRSTLRRHPNAVPVFATRPVRSDLAVETGSWMVEHLQGAGFSAAVARQLTRCLREYTIGHILSHAIATVAAQRTEEHAEPEADHFDVGLDAMLDGFDRHREVGRRPG
ncbi:TetR/AcrR family transcriptional regulator C-terminal domain-containing protein [Nocardia ninae]|uniref:TetR family transcriptional regulator n=1 Tax=Nocardia ninae NBRC 108245 TaxID=1210091 RepID=A0A511MSC8_9NOCA|nr:TetR/AcrR family transcriptional regulator C-terminal domain-containing protein [Nocardia ninae]GEM42936.1 TetR family transcriptional regulator [Nocardia ninae NBRC 108245]